MTNSETPPPTSPDDTVYCGECGGEKEYVDEPMISGVRGCFCTNDDCPVDS